MDRAIRILISALFCTGIVSTETLRADDLDLPDGTSSVEKTAQSQDTGSARQPGRNDSRTGSVSRAYEALDRGEADAAAAIISERGLSVSAVDRHTIEGRISFLKGRLSPARRSLQSAIKLDARRADNHYWLGRVYQSDGAHALAVSSFQRAYSLGLDSCDLHLNWARSLDASDVVLGEVRQERWNTEFTVTPSIGQFAFDGIVAQHVRGRPDVVIVAPQRSAIYQIHRAIAADPNRADAKCFAGALWAKLNQHRMSVELIESALRALKPTDRARGHEILATSSLALGRLDRYIEHTKEHMRLSGGIDTGRLAAAYDVAADEASARGQLKKQIGYLTFAAELDTTPQRLIRLADALLLAQRAEDAHRYLTDALEKRPSRAERAEINQRLARTSFLTAPESSPP
ncbi:MAG: hypothetical protein KF841_00535 [Phycisphaerae bacterium]|nr:hypothetical protein [Phycisphaerae bacterium]